MTIREKAVAAWPGAWQGKNPRDILTELGYDVDLPWHKLPRKDRDWILFTQEQPVVGVTPQRDRVAKPYKGRYWSARSHVLHTLADSKSAPMRERALGFMHSGPCEACSGSGLTAAALAVTVEELTIANMNELLLSDLTGVLSTRATADAQAPGSREAVATAISQDLLERIGILLELGLGYLSLGRSTPTLSPGEMQRLRIATQLRCGLFGVIYVLDEPSAGLHPADAEPLLAVLKQLKTSGNTVFIVEHNMDMVRQADWIVDVGPAAGENGGRVLYSGPIAGLAEVEETVTRPFLLEETTSDKSPAAGVTRRVADAWLELHGMSKNNLHHEDVSIPLGTLTAITGVSGAGKSTLLELIHAASDTRDIADASPGFAAVDRVVQVDQRPIGRTLRSNLATYTALFDAVRRTFAAADDAKARGFGPGRFSFNVAGGRCETCLGEGLVAVELLPPTPRDARQAFLGEALAKR